MFWPFDDGPRVSLHGAEQFDRRLLPHGVGSQGNQEVRHLGDVIQKLWPLRHHVLNLERVKCIKRLYRTCCTSKRTKTGEDKMLAVNVSLDMFCTSHMLCTMLTFLLYKNESHHVHLTCARPDFHIERWRGWWWNYRERRLLERWTRFETGFQYMLMWNCWIFVTRDDSVSIFVSITWVRIRTISSCVCGNRNGNFKQKEIFP